MLNTLRDSLRELNLKTRLKGDSLDVKGDYAVVVTYCLLVAMQDKATFIGAASETIVRTPSYRLVIRKLADFVNVTFSPVEKCAKIDMRVMSALANAVQTCMCQQQVAGKIHVNASTLNVSFD